MDMCTVAINKLTASLSSSAYIITYGYNYMAHTILAGRKHLVEQWLD